MIRANISPKHDGKKNIIWTQHINWGVVILHPNYLFIIKINIPNKKITIYYNCDLGIQVLNFQRLYFKTNSNKLIIEIFQYENPKQKKNKQF